MGRTIHKTAWIYDNGRWLLRRAKSKKSSLCPIVFCRNPRGNNGNLVCNACRLRRWRANNPVKRAFQIIKDRAKRRHQLFTIALADLLALVENAGVNYHGTVYHVDRRNPLRGYEPDNIQLLLAVDNLKKSAFDKIIHNNCHDPF